MESNYQHPNRYLRPGLRDESLRQGQPSRGDLTYQAPQPPQAHQPCRLPGSVHVAPLGSTNGPCIPAGPIGPSGPSTLRCGGAPGDRTMPQYRVADDPQTAPATLLHAWLRPSAGACCSPCSRAHGVLARRCWSGTQPSAPGCPLRRPPERRMRLVQQVCGCCGARQ